MRYFLLSLALAMFALNAHAALHKWVDADGKVHYSDTVPPDVENARNVHDFSGAAKAGASSGYKPKSYAEREAELKKANQKEADAAKKQADKDKMAEAKTKNCAAAHENVRVLENSPRISTYNDKGEKSYMDDAERAQKLDEARQAVNDYCN